MHTKTTRFPTAQSRRVPWRSQRIILAVCELAYGRGKDCSAEFDLPEDRAAVLRAEMRGLVVVTKSERHCLHARITDKGLQSLAWIRNQD